MTQPDGIHGNDIDGEPVKVSASGDSGSAGRSWPKLPSTIVARDLLMIQFEMDHWLRPWVRRERLGISPSLASVLYLIRDQATPTLRSLADRLDVTPTAITSITDRLESLGYVRRVRTSMDRRRTQLEITEAGREISFQVEESFVEDIQSILGSWDEERLREIQESARTLSAFLQDLSAVGARQAS
jgi:DNA-binding MarR family transcriptional regulator